MNKDKICLEEQYDTKKAVGWLVSAVVLTSLLVIIFLVEQTANLLFLYVSVSIVVIVVCLILLRIKKVRAKILSNLISIEFCSICLNVILFIICNKYQILDNKTFLIIFLCKYGSIIPIVMVLFVLSKKGIYYMAALIAVIILIGEITVFVINLFLLSVTYSMFSLLIFVNVYFIGLLSNMIVRLVKIKTSNN